MKSQKRHITIPLVSVYMPVCKFGRANHDLENIL